MRTLLPRFLLFLIPLCAASGAHAQIEQLTMNFTEVEFSYQPGAQASIPFGIDLMIAPDDTAVIKLPGRPRATDVTLKRGVIGSELAEFEFLVFDTDTTKRSEEALGKLSLDARSDAVRAGLGIDLVSATDTAGAPGTLQITQLFMAPLGQLNLQWQPVDGVRLAGEPASQFNRPQAGQPLIAMIDLPEPGSSVEHTLRVIRADALDRWESTLQIRIHRAQ